MIECPSVRTVATGPGCIVGSSGGRGAAMRTSWVADGSPRRTRSASTIIARSAATAVGTDHGGDDQSRDGTRLVSTRACATGARPMPRSSQPAMSTPAMLVTGASRPRPSGSSWRTGEPAATSRSSIASGTTSTRASGPTDCACGAAPRPTTPGPGAPRSGCSTDRSDGVAPPRNQPRGRSARLDGSTDPSPPAVIPTTCTPRGPRIVAGPAPSMLGMCLPDTRDLEPGSDMDAASAICNCSSWSVAGEVRPAPARARTDAGGEASPRTGNTASPRIAWSSRDAMAPDKVGLGADRTPAGSAPPRCTASAPPTASTPTTGRYRDRRDRSYIPTCTSRPAPTTAPRRTRSPSSTSRRSMPVNVTTTASPSTRDSIVTTDRPATSPEKRTRPVTGARATPRPTSTSAPRFHPPSKRRASTYRYGSTTEYHDAGSRSFGSSLACARGAATTSREQATTMATRMRCIHRSSSTECHE